MENNRISFLSAHNDSLFFQLVRFGIVGLTCAAIQFLSVVFLVQNHVCTPLVANVFGFILAFQGSYWGHSLWTFGHTALVHRVALPKLLFVQLLNFAINELLFYVFLLFKLPYPVALLIVLAILPMFTFIVSKLWIFR